jgi:hypothetical protein
VTEPTQDAGHCPKCGAASEPLQEYCLECGERLPTNRGTIGVLASAWRRRFPWYPGDWIWLALLFLLVAVVATAVATVTTSNAGTTIVATEPNVTLGFGTRSHASATTAATTLASTPKPTITTGALPKAPGAVTTGAAAVPPPAGLTVWPATGTAYTNVLESLPVTAGLQAAEGKARAAKAAGLPQAGILVSTAFPSLHPGYYIVFSGVYRSPAEAAGALDAARSHGFPNAYVARVTHR